MSETKETFPLTRALLLEGVACIHSEHVVGKEEAEELRRQYDAAIAELDRAHPSTQG